MSHFFVAVIIALALWFRSRPRYLRFMTAFVGMTTLGYITYVLYLGGATVAREPARRSRPDSSHRA
jgi:hypothetical protein